jgi:hypothetical protein
MASLFLTNLSAGQVMSSSFVQAVGTIESYCTWIASQSVSDGTLNATLQQVKVDASTWYSTIYPNYLNMPLNITTIGTTIDGDLNMLITLAQQLGSTSSQPIEQQIAQYSTSLSNTLLGLQTQINALVTLLTNFQNNLNKDAQILNTNAVSIQNTLISLGQQMANLYGKLHSLQNATCPSKGDINACQNLIQSTQTQINTNNQALQVFSQALNSIQGAINGAGYLSNFWMGFSADIQACNAVLANIVKESGTILVSDLQANKVNWDATQASLLQIIQQIGSPN